MDSKNNIRNILIKNKISLNEKEINEIVEQYTYNEFESEISKMLYCLVRMKDTYEPTSRISKLICDQLEDKYEIYITEKFIAETKL